jgi:phosphoglycerate dehydrogenase-like enzyme
MGGGPDQKTLVIVLHIDEPKEIVKQIREQHPSLNVVYHKGTSETISKDVYKEADYLYTLGAVPDDPKTQAPKLRWIHLFSAGINQLVGKPVWDADDITLTTSSGVHVAISEWVIMTFLNSQHFYNELHDNQKKKTWDLGPLRDELNKSTDSVGQRIGILGYGSIGRQVARVSKAMGMDVLAYTASPKDTPESKKDHDYVVPGTGDIEGEFPSAWYSGLDKKSLHNFLKQDLDFLLVSVPLT